MQTRELMFSTIKQFCGQANVIVVPTALLRFFSHDFPTALLMSQLLYWTDRTESGWIAKSAKDWYKEIALSEYQVSRSTNTLRNMGLIQTELRKFNGAPTLHYKVNIHVFYEKFVDFIKHDLEVSEMDFQETKESISKKLRNPFLRNSGIHSLETQESITEITTETTTEITTDNKTYDHPADDRACTSAPATQNSPKERRCISSTDILDEKNKKAFSLFWSVYPRKVGKGAAARAWKNLKLRDGDKDLCKAILEGAKRMKEVATYTDKQYIPHPATWLNQRRWEDEDVPEPPRDKIVDPDRDVPMTEYVSLRGKISTMDEVILQRLDSLEGDELEQYKKLVLQNQKYKHLIDKWESKKRSKVS